MVDTGSFKEESDNGSLSVRSIIQIVRDWVEFEARHMEGFAGAYLWGGITALAPDSRFPLYRDVDVVIVKAEEVPDDESTVEVFYRGLSLEVILHSVGAHQDVESALSNPSLAPNIVATEIFADPLGILAPLKQAVTAEFTRRRWVRARCEREKAMAEEQLDAMRGASTTADALNALWLFLNALSGLLAVAQLKRPTTRRTLTLLGDLLDEQGRSDLREAALSLWGSAHLSREEVETMLEQCAHAFDRACDVYQTKIPYGFVMRPHLRPYLVEGSQELIDEGNHREATHWIVAMGGDAHTVVLNDAPGEEQHYFRAQLQAIHESLGYTTPEAWARRVENASRLARELYQIADELVALNPE